MVNKETMVFTCDFCEKGERGKFVGRKLLLPEGWKGRITWRQFCSGLCEGQFHIGTLRERLKRLETEAACDFCGSVGSVKTEEPLSGDHPDALTLHNKSFCSDSCKTLFLEACRLGYKITVLEARAKRVSHESSV